MTRYIISEEAIQAAAEPMTIESAPRKVGAFSITASGVIEGPAAYMATRGAARLRRIEAGMDAVFSYGIDEGYDPLTLTLVSLQTDYAAYLGDLEMAARSAVARDSQRDFLARMAACRKAR